MLGLRGLSKTPSTNEKMETLHVSKTNGNHQTATTNGVTASSSSGDSFSRFRSVTSSTIMSSEQTSIEMTIVYARKRLITELVNVDELFINEMSIEGFIDFLNKERLTSMPQRGSRWDRALRAAEYFALQISAYAELLEEFTPNSLSGVNVGLASCRLLLQLGQEQAQALEASFAMLYKLGFSLRFLIKHSRFAGDFSIQNELQQAFCTLLRLVSEMAVTYRAKLSSMSRKTATIDFYGVFGRSIDQFYRQKERIADSMWNLALQQERVDSSVHISAIREWLEPGDSVLKLLASNRLAAKVNRAEFTCEWFQSHLMDFIRGHDQTFAITGPTGSGKTVLAGWIEERLQRQLARRSHETIEYSFESDLPTEATSLACVKSLILQLLQQNVGNVQFFSRILSAYRSFISTGETDELKNSLWQAFDLGLRGYEKENQTENQNEKTHLIIVIDGLEKVTGGDSKAAEFAKRIHQLAEDCTYVRAVMLSTSRYTNQFHNVKELQLTSARNHDDIRRMVYDILYKNHHLRDLTGEKKAKVQEQIVDRANGSFLWAALVAKSMIREETLKGFFQVADEAPKDSQGLFDRLMSRVHLKQPEVKRLLGWVLVARRPLTISELSELLRLDTQHNVFFDKKTDVRRFIRDCLGLLLVVRAHSVVRFRHSALRQHLSLLIERNVLPPLQDAQNDLLLRLLLYSKHCFQEEDPSFEMLPGKDIDDISRRHCLLEYGMTYWVTHFRETSMYHKRTFELSSEFKAVFPSSVQIVLYEWSRWTASLTLRGSLELHDLCLRLRKAVFGEKHVMVLQTLVVLSNIHRECHDSNQAINAVFQASQIAIDIKYQSIALKCSAMFLTLTEVVSDTTRTEIIIRREKTLRFVIAEYRHTEESELVVRYTKLLIQLYIQIQEEESANRVHLELREFIIKYYGQYSDELAEIEKLKIVLRKGKESGEITPWEGGSLFEVTEEIIEIIDVTQFEVIIRKAGSYEAQREVARAEELFVSLWRRSVELCHAEMSIEHQIAKFDCAIAYVRFLQRVKRHEEATAILICLWAEYESETFHSEVLVIRLKVVGELMRSFGLLSVAVSVFQKVWSWFKQTDKITHEEAQSTTVLISETIEELTTKETTTEVKSETTTLSTSTTTVKEETRTVISEIFKTQISSCRSTKEWKSVIKSCNAVVAVYCKEERWQEAISAVTTTLEIVWSVVLSGIGMIALPETCIHEAIAIAIRLAQCYVEEHRFEEAEKIYIRIYQACIFSLHIEDERVTNAVNCLIIFYERYHRHEKTIEIYSDIIACYKRQLGAVHTRTIKMLYSLSNMLRQYGYTRCYEYYLEIVTVLNKGSRVCHSDAFEAALILMKYYHSEKRWAEARNMCEILWAAFVHHHQKRRFEIEIVKLIYTTYAVVLEAHLKVDYIVQHRVALEYKETCTKYFGASSTITIEASIAYASVCERHEKYEHEAISVYEEVIKKTSSMTSTASTTIITSTSTSIMQRVKSKLTKLYVRTISSSQTTTSTTTVERAISLSVEKYSESKLVLGCWHETTISHLHSVLVLYRKLNTKESHAKIISVLRELVVEIVSVEKSSWRLYNAAIGIANLFLELDISGEGFELLQELHGQVITIEKPSGDKGQLQLSQHHGKATYIFLVVLELKLRRSIKISYSEIMVNLITESMLFESFKRVTQSKAKVEIILLHGARLRQFLYTSQRHYQCQIVEKQVFEVFIHSYGASIKVKSHASFLFFIALLEELGKTSKDINITRAACISGVNKVKVLIDRNEFQDAHYVADCVYQFTSSRDAYCDLKNVGWGLKLCQYLAGGMIARVQDDKLQHLMVDLSKTALRHILDSCLKSGMNFVRLPEENLEELVTLLGRQHNHRYLEDLLQQLWTSREAQKVWSQDLIIGTGRSLVNAKFVHGHRDEAIELCEDICYNLRRARGSTDPTTLLFYKLHAEMLTSTKRFEEALGAHKDVLKLIVDGEDHDDYDADDADEKALIPAVATHVQGLKDTCQRLGGWDHQEQEIRMLVNKALKKFVTVKIDAPEKWDLKKKPAEQAGTWQEPAKWTLRMEVRGSNKRHESRKQVRRVMSNYGMNGAQINGFH